MNPQLIQGDPNQNTSRLSLSLLNGCSCSIVALGQTATTRSGRECSLCSPTYGPDRTGHTARLPHLLRHWAQEGRGVSAASGLPARICCDRGCTAPGDLPRQALDFLPEWQLGSESTHPQRAPEKMYHLLRLGLQSHDAPPPRSPLGFNQRKH